MKISFELHSTLLFMAVQSHKSPRIVQYFARNSGQFVISFVCASAPKLSPPYYIITYCFNLTRETTLCEEIS